MKKYFKKVYQAWINRQVIKRHKKNNRIGRNVFLHRDTMMGTGCRLGDNVTIARDVVLGNNVTIGSGAYLERITLGDNSVFEGKAIITGHGVGRITIGRESFVGHNSVLDFSDNITIGDYVHIGYNQFWTHSSAKMCVNGIPLADKSERHRPRAPINIGNCVYVGVHSTVYPGVTIGHHSIIAPNSVVSKDVAPFSMMGGVPASLIKSTKALLEGEAREHGQL